MFSNWECTCFTSIISKPPSQADCACQASNGFPPTFSPARVSGQPSSRLEQVAARRPDRSRRLARPRRDERYADGCNALAAWAKTILLRCRPVAAGRAATSPALLSISARCRHRRDLYGGRPIRFPERRRLGQELALLRTAKVLSGTTILRRSSDFVPVDFGNRFRSPWATGEKLRSRQRPHLF